MRDHQDNNVFFICQWFADLKELVNLDSVSFIFFWWVSKPWAYIIVSDKAININVAGSLIMVKNVLSSNAK